MTHVLHVGAVTTAFLIGLVSVLCRYWCLIIFVLKRMRTSTLHKRSILTTMLLLWHQLCCTNSDDYYCTRTGRNGTLTRGARSCEVEYAELD